MDARQLDSIDSPRSVKAVRSDAWLHFTCLGHLNEIDAPAKYFDALKKKKYVIQSTASPTPILKKSLDPATPTMLNAATLGPSIQLPSKKKHRQQCAYINRYNAWTPFSAAATCHGRTSVSRSTTPRARASVPRPRK